MFITCQQGERFEENILKIKAVSHSDLYGKVFKYCRHLRTFTLCSFRSGTKLKDVPTLARDLLVSLITCWPEFLDSLRLLSLKLFRITSQCVFSSFITVFNESNPKSRLTFGLPFREHNDELMRKGMTCPTSIYTRWSWLSRVVSKPVSNRNSIVLILNWEPHFP